MSTRTDSAVLDQVGPPRERRPNLLERLVLERLERIESGCLKIHENGRTRVFGGVDSERFAAEIHVRDRRFWRAVATRGSIGAGESYARGWWESDDPTTLVRLFLRNKETLYVVDAGLARLSRPLLAAWHALRRNTEDGSRENIRAHYDLSNEFFGLFLDETMTYSCGIFEGEDASLRDASVAKIDRLCRKLDLGPNDHLLEIGTGWGALAIHAAREYGCRVTTTTISREQHRLASERLRAAGLAGRVELLLEDYRRLSGRYDKLVSVEMIEAVGHQYYEEFFRRCTALLEPEGRMALQAITIADDQYERARREVDFIKRYIFPGSCIPSVTALCAAASRSSDLRLVHLEDIGAHYVRTLAEWRKNLRERWDEGLALGLDEELLRLFEFYFCYCEGGFAERQIGDAQMLFSRGKARFDPPLAVLPAPL